MLFSLLAFGIHQVLDYYLLRVLGNTFYQPWLIHAFLFVITTTIFAFVVYIKKIFADKAAFAFLGGSFMKMMLSILFLIPLIKDKEHFSLINVITFFAVYFMYLAFETYYILKLINKK